VTALTDAIRCQAGDWVEVERVLLEPADRSKNLPPETAEKPLRMWIKGFAQAAGALGDPMAVETMTGRLVEGSLSAVNPGYFHTFGNPIPELARVGVDLRARLAEYHASEGGGC
jgi:2-amino-4-ketopentanoate thiolase alpha subunit